MTVKRFKLASGLVAFTAGLGLLSSVVVAAEGGGGHHFAKQSWSFGGVFGQYDQKQLRRGFEIYKGVCSGCHSMNLLSYRNLTEPGGPQYSADYVKKMLKADEVEVPLPYNDEGEITNEDGDLFTRPATLADRFKKPYANDNAAKAANGGALPPDFSVIAKARGMHANHEGIPGVFTWVFALIGDVLTQYQEGGPDYIYNLMTNYHETVPAEAPKDFKLPEGKYYNAVFPGHAISMAPPLSDGIVEYTDGTKATLDNHAKDISAFLMWASEPHLNARKRRGFLVLIYLAVLSLLLYGVKRAIWADVKH